MTKKTFIISGIVAVVVVLALLGYIMILTAFGALFYVDDLLFDDTQLKKVVYTYSTTHPLVESAKKQIGVVTKYDTGYYKGGYPPQGSGACTDAVEFALRNSGYDIKAKIDKDMLDHPDWYPHKSDPNINFRRVRNVKVFLEHYATPLSTCVDASCFSNGTWQAGDIVTFDQIPGSLWHIAIVSNKMIKGENGVEVPLLVHNYGRGVIEDDMLLNWPAPISGHYRLKEFSKK